MTKMAVVLPRREAGKLVRNYDKMREWIFNHAELCEEKKVLAALDRQVAAAGGVIDQIEAQLKQ